MRYYLDTEFNGYGGELISLALVREHDGFSYYCTFPLEHVSLDPWVKENVVPILHSSPVGGFQRSEDDAADDIAAYLRGDPEPVIVTDWPADIRYFCGVVEFPMGAMADIPALKFEMHRVDAYPTNLLGAVQHNAWWDAMALRHKLAEAGCCASRPILGRDYWGAGA